MFPVIIENLKSYSIILKKIVISLYLFLYMFTTHTHIGD